MNEVWHARNGIVARVRIRSRRPGPGRGYLAAAGGAARYPRSPQGRIYPLACLIAIALCAFTAAGNDRLTAVGQWVRRASQADLARLRAPWDPMAGRYRVPDEKTIRDLAGAVVTFDALHTVRANLDWLVTDKQAQYIAVVKRNQPLLHAQVRALPWRQVPAGSVTRGTGHGRAETRTLKAAHVSGLDFPHARQAIEITRWRQDTPAGRITRQTVYAVTSLTSADTTARDLARLVREHWSIEAHHHVRSPGVLSLSHDVAPERSAESFCNTSPRVRCSLFSLLKSPASADLPHARQPCVATAGG